mmetsp:Transcript_7022/g.6260  ORF Transcript_7022/g.6260 Transcript_7022/m.6260 type:complete len:230 (+) Transcript_7022:54-743(+)
MGRTSHKKQKVPKDENAPKKGKSAFIYYVGAKKQGFEQENPGLKHKEVIAKLSKIWNASTADEKKPFQDLALADQARYKQQKEAYVNSKEYKDKKKKLAAANQQNSNKKVKKAPKDENAPKKGKSAFLYYVGAKKQGFEQENPDLKHKEVISKLSKQWNELSAEEKKPFQDLALADQARYKQQKEAYVNSKKGGDKEVKVVPHEEPVEEDEDEEDVEDDDDEDEDEDED